jgi:hypothetical protein
VYACPTVGGSVVQNVDLVATKAPTRRSEAELLARSERRDVRVDLQREVRSVTPPPRTDDAPVLRDDRAPSRACSTRWTANAA